MSYAFCIPALVVASFIPLGCAASDAPPSGGSCAGDSQCGGDLIGVWEIDSECLTIDSPFSQKACASAIQNVSVTAQGTVTYSADDAERHSGTQASVVTYQLSASERYGEACLKALGFEGATAAACQGLALLWAGAVSVTCSPVSGACQCDFADAQSLSDSLPFSLDQHQIVLPGGERVDYCRTGERLVQTTTTDSSRTVVTLHLKAP